MAEDKHSADFNERLEAEMTERYDRFERYKEQRKWQGVMGREELIALCATYIFAGSFGNKLDHTGSDNAWNAVKMAAQIVDYSFTYDDLQFFEGQKRVKELIEGRLRESGQHE